MTDPSQTPPNPTPLSPTPQLSPTPDTTPPPSPTINQPTLSPTLTDLATKFSIDTSKPFFPVNTMRLLYLLIVNGLTHNNTDIVSKVNTAITRTSIIIDARNSLIEKKGETDPQAEITECQEEITSLLEIVDTPVIHHTFDMLFSDLYPLQENLLFSLDRHLKEKTLQVTDLYSILKIRAMDSVVYSSVLGEIIKQHLGETPSGSFTNTTPVHWQINVSMQINDLVDAIVHAKEDLENNSAPLIEIIRRTIKTPDDVETIVTNAFAYLTAQSQKLPFPEPVQSHITLFNTSLASIVNNTQTSTS